MCNNVVDILRELEELQQLRGQGRAPIRHLVQWGRRIREREEAEDAASACRQVAEGRATRDTLAGAKCRLKEKPIECKASKRVKEARDCEVELLLTTEPPSEYWAVFNTTSPEQAPILYQSREEAGRLAEGYHRVVKVRLTEVNCSVVDAIFDEVLDI
jgi:hypothetical protein